MLGFALAIALPGSALGTAAVQEPRPQARPSAAAALASPDPRTLYDVISYRLDLRLDPPARSLSGSVVVEARVLSDQLEALVLDLHRELTVTGASLLGEPPADRGIPFGSALESTHLGDRLTLTLPRSLRAGESLCVAVHFGGEPRSRNDFDGFHWRQTPSGEPWIGTSVQALGAHTWWPCKSSFYHPEDKPERVAVNATVPAGLVAVSNGVLVARELADGNEETFRWVLDYPCQTYAVTLNVAPYVELSGELHLPGLVEPVPYAWYVLPESVERARSQFAILPDVLGVYSRRFGPWPFPKAKIGLVETSFWGMEHTTAIAYGSSFPAWLAKTGQDDPYATRNRWFDYVLVHEFAHEWWGNSVSAADWGDFWLHEGFATYAGGVYVEDTRGRAEADRFFLEQGRFVHPKATLHRGHGTNSREAFSGVIYSKGACVLNTLRHYLDDDQTWWRLLRDFQARHRYGNASTEDFRALLEELSGRDWAPFFRQWVHSPGFPRLVGRISATPEGVLVEVDNPAAPTGFDVPLDLAWLEAGERVERRLWLAPGATRVLLPCATPPAALELLHLERVLGEHAVRVER